MSEQDMRYRVIRALKPLDAIPVENVVGRVGCPDVNYIGGWMELKWDRSWPVRGGPLRVPHFTEDQRRWLRRRARRGGSVWVLLQVRREWILMSGVWAAERLGYATRDELIEGSHRCWLTGLKNQELVECLTEMAEGA